MLRVTIKQLEYLLAVAEAGTIDAAAQKLLVSAVAIGKQLAELDHIYGQQLTIRERAKGVYLTPAGEEVVTHARTALRHLHAIPTAIDLRLERMAREVCIGVFPSLASAIIPAILEFATTKTPDIHVTFTELEIRAAEAALENNEIDFYIAYANQLPDDATADIIQKVRPFLLVSAQHKLADRTHISLHELHDEQFVTQKLSPARERVHGILRKFNLEGNIRYESISLPALHGIVGRNLAISLLYGVRPPVVTTEGTPLHHLEITDELPRNALVVRYPNHSEPSLFQQKLHEFLVENTGN